MFFIACLRVFLSTCAFTPDVNYSLCPSIINLKIIFYLISASINFNSTTHPTSDSQNNTNFLSGAFGEFSFYCFL